MRLILLILSFFVALSVFSQVTVGSQYYQILRRSDKIDRILHDSVLGLPKKPAVKGIDTGAIYYRLADSSILVWTGSQWRAITGLPSQTGNNGKYLTTDGSVPSWGTIAMPTYTDGLTKRDDTVRLGGLLTKNDTLTTEYNPNTFSWNRLTWQGYSKATNFVGGGGISIGNTNDFGYDVDGSGASRFAGGLIQTIPKSLVSWGVHVAWFHYRDSLLNIPSGERGGFSFRPGQTEGMGTGAFAAVNDFAPTGGSGVAGTGTIDFTFAGSTNSQQSGSWRIRGVQMVFGGGVEHAQYFDFILSGFAWQTRSTTYASSIHVLSSNISFDVKTYIFNSRPTIRIFSGMPYIAGSRWYFTVTEMIGAGFNSGMSGIYNNPVIDLRSWNETTETAKTFRNTYRVNIINGDVIGAVTKHPSAIFEVAGTTGGLLPPRMNTTQMNAIVSPATGLLVDNTDSAGLCRYNGSAWRLIGGGGGATPTLNQVALAGNTTTQPLFAESYNITNPTLGNLGIYDDGTIAGNATFQLYNNNAMFYSFLRAVNLTGARVHNLPDSSGTFGIGVKVNGTTTMFPTNGIADLGTISGSMVYPSAGIAVSTGSAWGTSITDNSTNWNTAFSWGNHATAGYLTTASAAATYQPLLGFTAENVSNKATTFGTLNNTLYPTTQAVSDYVTGLGYLTTATGDARYPLLSGTYNNPTWINQLAWSKITSVPANITSFGSLANASGWLRNNGAGVLSYSTPTKSDVGLGLVENTALSTWTGSTALTTVGTIGAGTWQGALVAPQFGGTGVNNGSRTLTVNTNSGTLSFTNAATTLTIANTGSISGTNTGDQTITLTGDVTGSGTGSFAATIGNAVVTYAKIQNVAANSFLANVTGSPASMQAIATNRIPLFAGAITGTPDNTTFLRGDGTWAAAGGGSGTVTSVSVTSANGFAGSVATATTTPAITISTTVTGMLKGNGTAISAATPGTDYTTSTSTETFTNKRITSRIGTTASSATPTPNADTDDMYTVTALATGATFGAPTGTPTNGQRLTIRIKDNGGVRTLGWNAVYRAGTTMALPTTTVINRTMYLGFIYNSADLVWDFVSFMEGF